MTRLIFVTVLMCVAALCRGQHEEIVLNNASFEDIPHQGTLEYAIGIRGWYDCGSIQFPTESPPDIHPVSINQYQDFWGVIHAPQHGETYLGLVVRDNDSWESLSQRISAPLRAGQCYEISLYTSRSLKYVSGSHEIFKRENRQVKVNYTEPVVLRIWGGSGVCGRQELLAESKPVSNLHWKKYTFKLEPSREYNYISFGAFYEVPVMFPYNGHLLLDNISTIVEIPCNDLVTSIKPKNNKDKVSSASPKQHKKSPQTENVPSQPVQQNTHQLITSRQPKKVSGLGYNKITKGQIITIENLYFHSDKTEVLEESHEELNRIFEFLTRNRGVVVEIGGHTNTVPPKEYCMKLSKERAKAVADYLLEKGIAKHRIKYRGYGKTNPIVEDDKYDMEARQKNQRVEIKILELG